MPDVASDSAAASGTARHRAADVVTQLAARLADPESVLAHVTRGGTYVELDGARSALWGPTTLSRGYPALVVLFAELGCHDDVYRETAHRYLTLAASSPAGDHTYGIADGPSAVANVARLAARSPGDYVRLLERLDTYVVADAHRLLAMQDAFHRHGQPTQSSVVDTLTGLAGVGRYLLAADSRSDLLERVLGSLCTLAGHVRTGDAAVPGWWYGRTMTGTDAPLPGDHGQAVLGLAHGVAGPLAVLSLAWASGMRVAGHEDAVRAMSGWLLEWLEHGGQGPYWPAEIPFSRYRDRARSAVPEPLWLSWCLGSLGTASALGRAGRVFGEPAWDDAARAVVQAALTAPLPPRWADVFCHGRAGALHLVNRLIWDGVTDVREVRLGLVADRLAAQLCERFDADAPFGYRYGHPSWSREFDLPGLLEGASGIALALHAYATGRPPASGWDRILMLS